MAAGTENGSRIVGLLGKIKVTFLYNNNNILFTKVVSTNQKKLTIIAITIGSAALSWNYNPPLTIFSRMNWTSYICTPGSSCHSAVL